MRLKWYIAVAATMLVTPASHAKAYTVAALGQVNGFYVRGNGVNSSGTVAGQTTGLSAAQSRGVLSQDGVTTIIPGTYAAASINDAGQVAVYDNSNNGYLYADGALTNIGHLAGGSVSVAAINTSGQIVGGGRYSESASHAYVWSAVEGLRDIGTLSGYTSSYATDINDAGVIVGSLGADTGVSMAFLYKNGVMTALGSLAAMPFRSSYASAINNGGDVVGWSYSAPPNVWYHAFLYRNDAMVDLGSLYGRDSYATDINNLGQIVGRSARYYSDIDAYIGTSAFLYENGIMADLNTMIDPASGWHLDTAVAINDAGQIVGMGSYNGISRSFLLTVSEAPEPATWAMMMLGLGFIGRALRRRRVSIGFLVAD